MPADPFSRKYREESSLISGPQEAFRYLVPVRCRFQRQVIKIMVGYKF
jgi:hypothetical protein